MRFIRSLSRAARFYTSTTLAGIVLVFAGVEGWRAIAYLGAPGDAVDAPASMHFFDAVIAIQYVILSLSALRELGHGPHRLLVAMVSVSLATIALYPLFAIAGRLLLNTPSFDPLAATCLTMSALLGAYLLFHRKANR